MNIKVSSKKVMDVVNESGTLKMRVDNLVKDRKLMSSPKFITDWCIFGMWIGRGKGVVDLSLEIAEVSHGGGSKW